MLLGKVADDLNEVIGDFPETDIKRCLANRGVAIDINHIPKSFIKYFTLISANCGNNLAGKSLVDFGCGLGVFVAQAEKLGMKAERLDVFQEYNGQCLPAARGISKCISPNSSPIFSTVDLVFAEISRSADFVTSFGVLEHILGVQARNRFLGNMMNCLRPGGLLILTCGPNRRFPIDLFHYCQW